MNQDELNDMVGKTLVLGSAPHVRAANSVYEGDLPSPHRIIKPHQMVTMDYRVDRLNVYVDDSMVITRCNYG